MPFKRRRIANESSIIGLARASAGPGRGASGLAGDDGGGREDWEPATMAEYRSNYRSKNVDVHRTDDEHGYLISVSVHKKLEPVHAELLHMVIFEFTKNLLLTLPGGN